MALKPSEDRLFNQLMKYRNEIAEYAGVVPRGVISDTVLRKIADAKPITESTLLDVAGVSQLFVEKYGKLFLEEIKKHIANDFNPAKLTKVAKDVYRFVQRGLTIEEIAKKMFVNSTLVANYIKEAAMVGAPIKNDLYFESKELNKMIEFLRVHPDASVNRIKTETKTKMNDNQIKIASGVALFIIKEC